MKGLLVFLGVMGLIAAGMASKSDADVRLQRAISARRVYGELRAKSDLLRAEANRVQEEWRNNRSVTTLACAHAEARARNAEEMAYKAKLETERLEAEAFATA